MKGSGGLCWYSPRVINRSGKLTLAARTLIRTSPGSGAGVGISFSTQPP